ncbi:MAG: SGNH/GDSL hydrolase family protein [Lewinellaceae bacterium]|nr:SGNH/GDSL hydrolase family protein [Lewinellaceae bacterium]
MIEIKTSKASLTLYFLLILIWSGCAKHKPKILIVGDSISLGYTPYVREDLQGIAEVYHNRGNAQHTGTGLDSIETWIGTKDWDIIQFNWGLWDLCYRHPDSKTQGNRDKVHGTITYELEDYGKNLDSIVQWMKAKSDAKLIFVTTTYVPEDEAGRYQEDAIRYNQLAKRIMEENGVVINDIYEASRRIHRQYGKDSGDVHYLPEGYRALAKEITDFLKGEMSQ